LAVVLFLLIIVHPYAPQVLNNVGFAYLTCACIDIPAFSTHIGLFIGVFVVGSLIFNGVSILLMKPAKALAIKSVKGACSDEHSSERYPSGNRSRPVRRCGNSRATEKTDSPDFAGRRSSL